MVAPLVFRRHAAFRPDATASGPWVATNHQSEDRQFVSKTGRYRLCNGANEVDIPFSEAHHRLMPIGAHLLVQTEDVRHFGINAASNWLLCATRITPTWTVTSSRTPNPAHPLPHSANQGPTRHRHARPCGARTAYQLPSLRSARSAGIRHRGS